MDVRSHLQCQHSRHAVLLAMAAAFAAASGCCNVSPKTEPSPMTDAGEDDSSGLSGAVAVDEGGGAAPAGHAGYSVASSELGRRLYTRHCAACHGEYGDGVGMASVYLFPKARDFRAGRFRLVSTDNNIPSRRDLHEVLVRGMPGSSMPPWGHLSPSEREALIDEVMRLRYEGARDQYIQVLRDEEELSDEEMASPEVQEEIHQYASRFVAPGESSAVPAIPQPDEASLQRGRELYATGGCLQCHGQDGKGDGSQRMIDDEGFVTYPRDFTAGIFKGGHDPASLYRRIAYGMPGTPMPSSQQLTSEQVTSLVHYIRSLSSEEQRLAAELARQRIVAVRAEALPPAPDAAAWETVPAAAIATMPLWWRDGADIGLRVQAVHDGRSLAVRLSWNDATHNDRAVRPEEFADMAALQLCRAGEEPFLGMGAPDAQVDLWQWRAGLASAGDEDHLMDEYPFDTEVYDRFAGDVPPPDFITARAAGNPLARRDAGGANLMAGGLGSLTFRPLASQVVAASGTWSDGRWSVVLVRPLAVAPQEGLSLAADKEYAVAFAVWDGAVRDRAAQKQISIWNDLKLEDAEHGSP